MKVKQCPKCKQIKPVTEFNKKSAANDGLQSYCRSCQSVYPVERLETAESHFELIVLPGGIRCFSLKAEYR